MATRDERLARRRQVYTMQMRGYSKPQISKILGVAVSTVRDDVSVHERELAQMTLRIDPDVYIAQVLTENEDLRREAWRNYETAKKDTDRARFLSLVKSIREGEMRSLREAGLLDRTAKQEDTSHAGSTTISELSGAQLDALTAVLLAEEMGLTPEEVLGLGGRPPIYVEAGSNGAHEYTDPSKREKPLPMSHREPVPEIDVYVNDSGEAIVEERDFEESV